MKGRKFVSMGLAVLTAAVLLAGSVWAAEQDTGYPWFADIMKDEPISQSSTMTHSGKAPVWTSEQDTGYPWFADIMEYNQTILYTGKKTHCNDDFTVENMSKVTAEVHIVRGNQGNLDVNQIPPGGKLGYQLQDFAAGAGEGRWIDEARIINSTPGNSKLKVLCK